MWPGKCKQTLRVFPSTGRKEMDRCKQNFSLNSKVSVSIFAVQVSHLHVYWRMSEDLNFRLSQNIWFEFIIYLNKFVLKNAPCWRLKFSWKVYVCTLKRVKEVKKGKKKKPVNVIILKRVRKYTYKKNRKAI